MAARRPEREQARMEYVQGDDGVTIAGLAEKHGFNRKALQAVSASEGWLRQRAEFRRKMEVARLRRAVETAAAEAHEVDRLGLKLARRLLLRCERALDRDERRKAGRPGPSLKPADVLALANAGKAALAMAHAAVGSPDERAEEMERGVPGRKAITWEDVAVYARGIDLRMVTEVIAQRDRREAAERARGQGRDGHDPAPPSDPAPPAPSPEAAPAAFQATPAAVSGSARPKACRHGGCRWHGKALPAGGACLRLGCGAR